ncbi:MAG: hypothetical protein PVI57_09300, partial [Gemmatimonadota bacterium]
MWERRVLSTPRCRGGLTPTAVALAALSAVASVGPTLAPTAAHAQEPRVEEMDLPRHVADEVVDFFNDPGTIRFNGRSRVPAGREVAGAVGVLGGPFTVAGRVRGDLVVVNGDLRFEEGGEVLGDVTVIGGVILDREFGEVTGTVAVYEESLRYRERGGRIAVRREGGDVGGLRWG